MAHPSPGPRGRAALLAALLALPLAARPAASGEEAPDQALQSLGELLSTKVVVATGTPTAFQQVPATVTVITAADIQAMGVDSLDDALAMVPGLHVSHSGQLAAPRYAFRGIVSLFNPEVLVMIDGVPITSMFRGDRGNTGPRFPALAIARIEVIRGPGSAVYGADAFGGVINVITKDREHLDGTQGGVRAGSWRSREAWVGHGGDWGPVQVALMLSRYVTDGPGGTVDMDAQTGFDQLGKAMGLQVPPASRAPGPLNLQGHYWNLNFDAAWERWRFRLNHVDASDLGTGQGAGYALDPHGRMASQRTLAELLWQDPDVGGHWGLEAQGSFYRGTQRVEKDLHLFPPGSFFGAFPQGFIGNPEYWERSSRLELSGVHSGFAGHRIRLGAGFHQGELYHIRESKNFDASFNPLPTGLTFVSGTPAVYLPESKRGNVHGFVQDEWHLGPGWDLTAGLRHDHYTDFGDTTNPRLALVWGAAPDLTAKLLYGQAFRAPSFVELYTRNNPVALGNPHLRPERIATTEVAFTWQATEALQWDLSLFDYRIRDFITFQKDAADPGFTAQNSDRLKGRGGELALLYAPTSRHRVTANLSYQDARVVATGAPLGDAPRWTGYLRGDWTFLEAWQADAELQWTGVRNRASTDPRPSLGGAVVLNLVLRRWRILEHLDLLATVRNALDRDLREPSFAPNAGAAFVDIPHDLPQPGRNYAVALSWRPAP